MYLAEGLVRISHNVARANEVKREAVEHMGKAIELDRTFGPAYVYRAGVFAAFGEGKKALADLEQAKKCLASLDPRIEQSIRKMIEEAKPEPIPGSSTPKPGDLRTSRFPTLRSPTLGFRSSTVDQFGTGPRDSAFDWPAPSQAEQTGAREDVAKGRKAAREGSKMLAEFWFNSAIRSDPTNPDAYEELAASRIESITVWDYPQIVKTLKRGEELGPGPRQRIDGLLQRAGREVAVLFVKRGYGQLDQDKTPAWAEQSFDSAVQCDPSSADAHEGRGRGRYHQLKWPEAAADLKRAVELDPGSGR